MQLLRMSLTTTTMETDDHHVGDTMVGNPSSPTTVITRAAQSYPGANDLPSAGAKRQQQQQQQPGAYHASGRPLCWIPPRRISSTSTAATASSNCSHNNSRQQQCRLRLSFSDRMSSRAFQRWLSSRSRSSRSVLDAHCRRSSIISNNNNNNNNNNNSQNIINNNIKFNSIPPELRPIGSVVFEDDNKKTSSKDNTLQSLNPKKQQQQQRKQLRPIINNAKKVLIKIINDF